MRFIYLSKNLINGKCYVGQTKDFNQRVKGHLLDAEKGKGFKFHAAIRKYGKENFSFEIIEECDDEIANEKEKLWIARFDAFTRGYNMTSGGEFFEFSNEVIEKIRIANSNLTDEQKYIRGSAFRGKTLSDDHKQKLREANLGKKPPPHSEETLQRMSNSMIGKNTGPKSEEHKRKLSLAHKGKTLSEEHKEKLRNKPITDETRQKISNAGKGRIATEETRKKQSEALMGIKRGPQTEEVKERRAQKLRGRKQTEEAKQKMRDAWARKREERKLLTTDSK